VAKANPLRTDQRFGKLVVIGRAAENPDGKATGLWHFLCDCGQRRTMLGTLARYGQVKSCGHCVYRSADGAEATPMRAWHRYKPGTQFGNLTLIRLTPGVEGYWTCLCECGAVCSKYYRSIFTGKTKSCGCLRGRFLPPPDLGKVPDSELATRMGIPIGQVARWRRRSSLPPAERVTAHAEDLYLIWMASETLDEFLQKTGFPEKRMVYLRRIWREKCGHTVGKKPTVAVAEFIRQWNTSSGVDDFMQRTGRSDKKRCCTLASIYRKRGWGTKDMVLCRTTESLRMQFYKREEFARIWNASEHLEDVAEHFGVAVTTAATRSTKLWRAGFDLKPLHRRSQRTS